VAKKVPDYNVATDGVTQGLLAAWMTCRQKARWACERWSQKRPAINTTGFGDLAHQALSRMYRLKESPTEDDVADLVSRLTTEFEKKHLQRAKAEDLEFLEILGINLEQVLQAYVRRYEEDWLGDQFVETELDFRVLVNGVPLRGKIDGVVRRGTKWWVFETKTRTQIADNLVRQLAIDFQSQLYCLALEAIRGKQAAGVLYNVIRNPGLKPGKGNLGGFGERLRADLEGRPDWYFRRFEVVGVKADHAAFASNLAVVMEAFKEWAAGGPCWRNHAACFGSWYPCDFLDLCTTGNTTGYIQRDVMFPELEPE